MKFGKLYGAGPRRAVGKPGQQEVLPSRHAVSQLVAGDPLQRSIGNYAKLTPSGASAPSTYAAILEQGEQGIDLKRR